MLREETSGAAREAVAASGRLHLSHVEPMMPRVHLNGTSRQDLLVQLEGVAIEGFRLLEAMGQAAPNGRDYYVIGDKAWLQARALEL